MTAEEFRKLRPGDIVRCVVCDTGGLQLNELYEVVAPPSEGSSYVSVTSPLSGGTYSAECRHTFYLRAEVAAPFVARLARLVNALYSEIALSGSREVAEGLVSEAVINKDQLELFTGA